MNVHEKDFESKLSSKKAGSFQKRKGRPAINRNGKREIKTKGGRCGKNRRYLKGTEGRLSTSFGEVEISRR